MVRKKQMKKQTEPISSNGNGDVPLHPNGTPMSLHDQAKTLASDIFDEYYQMKQRLSGYDWEGVEIQTYRLREKIEKMRSIAERLKQKAN
jgi:hypothetical protein